VTVGAFIATQAGIPLRRDGGTIPLGTFPHPGSEDAPLPPHESSGIALLHGFGLAAGFRVVSVLRILKQARLVHPRGNNTDVISWRDATASTQTPPR
jgi:hypothetical protein